MVAAPKKLAVWGEPETTDGEKQMEMRQKNQGGIDQC